jgi:hypothetical protein
MYQNYYLIRSKIDGKYLVANVNNSSYLLVYKEHFEALTYLNTHGGMKIAESLAIESINTNQLKGVLQRWGFTGIGIVEDPLLPTINFMKS